MDIFDDCYSEISSFFYHCCWNCVNYRLVKIVLVTKLDFQPEAKKYDFFICFYHVWMGKRQLSFNFLMLRNLKLNKALLVLFLLLRKIAKSKISASTRNQLVLQTNQCCYQLTKTTTFSFITYLLDHKNDK